jgi:hypothetical protein
VGVTVAFAATGASEAAELVRERDRGQGMLKGVRQQEATVSMLWLLADGLRQYLAEEKTDPAASVAETATATAAHS